ncbi:hypothetical protein KSF_036810 [Reticulibacter mediterranei]|uniref:Uncharacterized protein n=1 Tax=Reticulibacter mediterranei TaxID=2778369 RepID=A0A8J3IHA0_9CHLR|nr:hypothetical protein [Reticulibacter mediterranei]GHO93633.1 hypothetical protein KSF_036810 [Reticulibacter mediterranei]
MIEITKGGRATVNGDLVEYQLEGQPETLFSVGDQVRVKGGFAKIAEGEVICVAGEVRAERESKVAMIGGRVTITDSEVRLPTGAEDCLITAHGRSKIYLSVGIRMCEIFANDETIVYVPRDPRQETGRGENVATRGLYSLDIDLQGDARIEYLP